MKRQGWFTKFAVRFNQNNWLVDCLSAGNRRSVGAATLIGLASLATGCSALTQPISGIPARRLPPQFLAEPRASLVPIDISRLGQEPPRQYLLDGGDILGVYIEGILPFTPPDEPPVPPPVNFPERDSLLPPSLGFPIAVQEDGTIALPLIKPLNVKGMSVEQVREVIRKAYLDARILKEDGARVLTPIVTMIQERTVNIVVVRQDIGGMGGAGGGSQFNRGGFNRGGDESASGNLIKLRAYQNDVLHALMATGGLPGLNAKNEVRILRASNKNSKLRDEFIQNFYAQYYNNPDPCGCPPPLPDDPSVLKIPLRLQPGVLPNFSPEDMILQEGDIVSISSRDAEVFYTGGMLPGGEFPVPRDYDLDVLGAMAIAGAGIGSTANSGGAIGGFRGIPPGRLFIIRPLPCNGQVTIEVDITKAIADPRERPLVQAGDTILLQFKPAEELLNFSVATFFTFGVQLILQAGLR